MYQVTGNTSLNQGSVPTWSLHSMSLPSMGEIDKNKIHTLCVTWQ